MSDDIFTRYPELRGKPEAMALFCGALRKHGRDADAFALGSAAVAAAPGNMAVRDEVRRWLSSGVDRFHIPMLNDTPRNQAYARAIERAVTPGMKVLEIGTGAGLLSLIAARAGALVTTCEGNPIVAAAALEIVARNGLSDRIKVIPKVSSDVTIPGDLDEPADLIIHEIFGSMLIDEGVVGALSDARARLLKPGAPALPPRGCVQIALASAPTRSRHGDVGMVEGFDLSPFNLLQRPARRMINTGETGVEARSDPIAALKLDFDTPAPFGPARETVTLISYGGPIDGIVQWISLDFGDGTGHDNDPFGDAPRSSWGAPLVPFDAPIDTRPGDLVHVTLHHRGNLLTINAVKG